MVCNSFFFHSYKYPLVSKILPYWNDIFIMFKSPFQKLERIHNSEFIFRSLYFVISHKCHILNSYNSSFLSLWMRWHSGSFFFLSHFGMRLCGIAYVWIQMSRFTFVYLLTQYMNMFVYLSFFILISLYFFLL